MEEYIVPNRKRLPYGMMNFAVIRREDYYYVDKTSFIPLIEQSDRFFFFLRPRRFGKSLTVNMLQYYYDIRTKEKFDDLFGDLYIGKHPTRDRNSYLVIYLNFSGINGEFHNYREGLDAHCGTTFGFTLAMTAQNRFYRSISEADTQEGYADIFLCPLLEIYPDTKHSYIIELKYAKYKDPETRVEELRPEAIAQAIRYADTDRVKNAVGPTILHKIVVVFKGMEMPVCEEV